MPALLEKCFGEELVPEHAINDCLTATNDADPELGRAPQTVGNVIAHSGHDLLLILAVTVPEDSGDLRTNHLATLSNIYY